MVDVANKLVTSKRLQVLKIPICALILQAHNWDLELAISLAVFKKFGGGGGYGSGLSDEAELHQHQKLENRFKEIKDLKTDAVFSIDDDIIFPCHTVDFAFNVWESAPDTMVGFVPRVHWPEKSVMGMERLKTELQSRGLKCGGTLQERAARLFLPKSTPLDKLPKKV